jgi:hypothetical protein
MVESKPRVFLVSFIGRFTITLVAGILHVYHAPPDSIALKRPILTTGSQFVGDTFKLRILPFSAELRGVKSSYNTAVGILERNIFTVLQAVAHPRYTNKSASFVASSALPRLR